MLELKFAELHSPLFLAGKNFGLKLDHGKHRGIKLEYDRDHRELVVTWNDGKGEHQAIVPTTNVACMWPGSPDVKVATVTPVAGPQRASAQVTSPQAHVHAGPGAGRSR